MERAMKPIFKGLTLALALTLPLAAEASRGWILPTITVLAADNPWVSFEAASSEDIFTADGGAMRTDGMKVVAPDGTESDPQNATSFKSRTIFDLNLTQVGTWKVYSASNGLNARWEENGKRKMWPPRGTQPTAEGFEKEVPKQADKLEVSQFSRRVETFVTAGKPSTGALKPTNVGLELVPVTHPNDLYSGEEATFQLLIDGKPAAGANVAVIPGERRYRNSENAVKYTSDKNGKITVKWPTAGQYYLEAEYQDDQAPKPATKRVGRYAAALEILPQ